jgi:ribosome-binding protein aMBF1 (putative translation factor)
MISEDKEFISARKAAKITSLVDILLGQDLSEKLGKDYSKDLIRFGPVSDRCKQAREEKSLTIKQISTDMKIPQYRIRDVEKGHLRYIQLQALERYVDFLSISEWFALWKDKNKGVYKRLNKNSKK